MKLIKKIIIGATTFLMSISMAISSVAASQHGVITGSVVNVREQSNTSCSVLGQVSKGDQLNIVGTEGNFVKVAYNGSEAYIHSDYIEIREGAAQQSSNSESSLVNKLLNTANSCIGVPYKYGGTSTSGFDCSGFTYYSYKSIGITLARVAADQASQGTHVSKSNLAKGDLVFFNTGGSSRISHVGIYVGGGNFIHSPSPGKSVKVESLNQGYYSKNYAGARRIL